MILNKLEFYEKGADNQFLLAGIEPITFVPKKINLIIGRGDGTSGNGVGKTTALVIIDYCLGANISESITKIPNKNLVFSLTLTLYGKPYKIYRHIIDRNVIYIEEGDFSSFLIKPVYKADYALYSLGNREWLSVLEAENFGTCQNNISFRDLIYFYIKYSVTHNKDGEWILVADTHVKRFTLTYLLYILTKDKALKKGIDLGQKQWSVRYRMQDTHGIDISGYFEGEEWRKKCIKKQQQYEKEIEEHSKKTADLERKIENLGVEEDQKIIKNQIDAKSKELAEKYKIRNNTHIELKNIEKSLKTLEAASSEINIQQIQAIYEELEVLLKEDIKKTLEEVQEFHINLSTSRINLYRTHKVYLTKKLKETGAEIKKIAAERSEFYQKLYTDELTKILIDITKDIDLIAQEKGRCTEKLEDIKKIIQDLETLIASQPELQTMFEQFAELLDNFISNFDKTLKLIYDNDNVSYPKIYLDLHEQKFSLSGNCGPGKDEMAFILFDWIRNNQSVTLNQMRVQIHDNFCFSNIDNVALSKYFINVLKYINETEFQYIITLSEDKLECLKKDTYFISRELSMDNKLLKKDY